MKKKQLFLFGLLLILLFVPACKEDVEISDICKALGSHDLQYVSEGDEHWQECQQEGCSYRTEAAAHSGGVATCQNLAKCEACGALYGTYAGHNMQYVADEQTHTYQCSVCVYKLATENHSGGTATCTDPAKCEKCGLPYGEKIAHVLDSDGITCSKCHENYFLFTLSFKLSTDGSSYIVSGGKDCKVPNVIIPTEYKGLPVTEIGEMAFCDNRTIESIIIPDSVEVIGVMAFDGSTVKSVTLGSGLKTIRSSAFAGTVHLDSIILPASLTVIEKEAFAGTGIKNIVIPDSVEVMGEGVFSAANHLESVTIGAGIKTIPASCFSGTALKSITIPSNVEKINILAFAHCDCLKTVILPETLKNVEYDVFLNCPVLEYNIYEGMKYLGTATNPYFALAGYLEGTRLVTHADTKLCISKALLNCENIVSIEIGPNVEFIGENALGGMDALETITVDPRNTYFYVVNNILIDKQTNRPLQGCKTSTIPGDGSITEFDLKIFNWISSIKTIYIPREIKVLHMKFEGLDGLEAIIIEDNVEHLIIHGNDNDCNWKKEQCFAVYHCHTAEQWKTVEIEYTFNRNAWIRPIDCYGDTATHYFYSEAPPTDTANKYWHYVDGVPTPW